MIKKIKIVASRIKTMSLKRMIDFARLSAEASGRNIVSILFDMIWCFFMYGTGYLEYRKFGFDRIRKHAKRKTFMTMRQSITLEHSLNNPDYYTYFTDKANFNTKFAKYIGRDWIDLRKADYESYLEFCKKHSSIFAKPIDSFGGLGISKIQFSDGSDLKAIYDELISNKQLLIEECITQHEDMNKICPNAVNTMRVVTIYNNDKVEMIYVVLRMGNGAGFVDNATSGGIYCLVDDDGVIRNSAFSDKTALYYDKHPYTGVEFNGLKVPMFKESVELCLEAALIEPNMRYIGWDVAVSDKGPIFVEANNLPGYDLAQCYGHLKNDEGILPKITRVTGIEF